METLNDVISVQYAKGARYSREDSMMSMREMNAADLNGKRTKQCKLVFKGESQEHGAERRRSAQTRQLLLAQHQGTSTLAALLLLLGFERAIFFVSSFSRCTGPVAGTWGTDRFECTTYIRLDS